MPTASNDFSTAGDGALSGRILTGPAINRSANAWAPTVYNAEGLIVSAPDHASAAVLGETIRSILQDFDCLPEGPDWLLTGGETINGTGGFAAVRRAGPESAGALAVGVKIVPGSPTDDVPPVNFPDPWRIVEALRIRLGPDGAGSVGLNHLMSTAEQVGGNPLAVGHGRVGLDGYGTAGWGGHGPVALMLQPQPAVTGRRPRVVVLDTGIGDHPWFRSQPAETTLRFADGTVVGPNVAQFAATTVGRPATAPSLEGSDPPVEGRTDTAVPDPLRGTLPTHTGHGTFIAGLIRQSCPAADIVALTVMDATGFVEEHKLIRALTLLRDRQREDPGWADAIVLSLGYYAETGEDVVYTSGLKDILLDLGLLGIAVFAAAGNDATRRPSYPAAFAVDPDFAKPAVLPVVSVAALNPDGTVAPFSNDGPWVTAEAPGVDLVSASPDLPDAGSEPRYTTRGPGGRRRSSLDPDDYRSGFAVWSGTSFAAPVLAGEYLRRLSANGFPASNADRRALLPLGRRSRAAAPASVSRSPGSPAQAPVSNPGSAAQTPVSRPPGAA